MSDPQRVEVFKAQTRNVRQLEKTWTHINRQLNVLIAKNDENGIVIQSKLLALIYCGLAESLFSKIIHTPNGLDLNSISQIKRRINAKGIKEGWLKASDLALARVASQRSNHIPNVKKKLEQLINDYIFDPSLIRNKLAHGQWVSALNSDNTDINADATAEIEAITVIDLYKKKSALDKLSAMLEDLIKSPNKAHPRDYWIHLADLEERQREMEAWTIDKKKQRLFEKKYTPA